jgi:hypothetical protein
MEIKKILLEQSTREVQIWKDADRLPYHLSKFLEFHDVEPKLIADGRLSLTIKFRNNEFSYESFHTMEEARESLRILKKKWEGDVHISETVRGRRLKIDFEVIVE